MCTRPRWNRSCWHTRRSATARWSRLPDEKWGERVTAVVQPHAGVRVSPADVREFVKARLGSVKAPKQVEVWPDLPRSRIGKVLKTDIKATLA